MRSLRSGFASSLRRAMRLIVLPLLQGPEEILVGGQAVIEGVMMRSPHSFAVAVRRPAGDITLLQGILVRPSERHPWLKYPILRGLGTLGQALVLGIRALRYSAAEALEEKESKPREKKSELNNWLLALNLAISLGFFIFFYKLLPLYLATQVQGHYQAAENTAGFQPGGWHDSHPALSRLPVADRPVEGHPAHLRVSRRGTQGGVGLREDGPPRRRHGARLHALPSALRHEFSAGGDGHRHGALHVSAIPIVRLAGWRGDCFYCP